MSCPYGRCRKHAPCAYCLGLIEGVPNMTTNEYGNPESPPSWDQIEFNCLLILGSEDDPEDALAFQFTRESFALVCYGVQVAVRINPELHDAAERFLKKVYDLTEAQGWLDWGARPTLQAEMEDLTGGPDEGIPDFPPEGLA